MSLTFTYVPPVASGAPVTSTQLNTIADAFNDRLRCNAGDSCERIVYLLFTQFRQIRNSDGGSLFPQQAEFLTAYQNVKATDGTYPVGDPGDVAGANLACIMNAFVFGAEAIDLDSEDLRIADPSSGGVPLWIGLSGVPSDPQGIWDLGKQQRGAVSLAGSMASPSFSAAIEHYKIRSGRLSQHGHSYGGFMPVPVDLGDCYDDGVTYHPDYQIFFTNTKTNEIFTAGGTCPERSEDVASVIATPLFYIVWFNNGRYVLLPIDDWIQGPYAGGSTVQRNWGDFLPRALNAFANDFRGTPSERATQTSWLATAFDREKFLTSQYHLSPNIGVGSGDVLTEVYPNYQATCAPGTTLAAGVNLVHTQSGGISHHYAAGFVLASALLTTTRLSAPCDVEFWNGATKIKTVTLTPDGSGNAPQLVTFDPAIDAPVLSIVLPNGATFSNSTGAITVECTELMAYKPHHHDLYLCLRLASCRTSLTAGLDGSGENEDNSNQISDSYFANGAILNSHGAPGPAGSFDGEVNSNAVFDAARRLSQFARVLPRDKFLRYAVEDGRSICWFERYIDIDGVPVDQFDGIAPSRTPIDSGSLLPGKVYIVRDASITYNGNSIAAGQSFIAGGVLTFSGDGNVYEREGIRHTAEPRGFTNEWLMGAQLKVYSQFDTSQWKASAYSDYWFWSDRCHWMHDPANYGDLQNQFDYGSLISFAPEAFSGWRYAHNTNSWPDGDADNNARRLARYKSCRIYEPLPEIDSVTEDFEGGIAVVKLTFKGRFHHHESAPEHIDPNVMAWNVSALQAETYRTMENALREYLVYQGRGFHCTGGAGSNTGQQGNSAFFAGDSANPWEQPDTPHGACFPHFYFTKLFPKPYEDGNNKQDAVDTPLWADWWAQADLYLRATCEGFVDGLTTTELACTLGVNAIFCYTFESMCFQSHEMKWLSAIASKKTALLSKVREDAPEGFGQAPNISISSECYNQIAGSLNLLNRVQIMLPQQFQIRNKSGTNDANVDATWPPPTPPTCSSSGGSPMGYYQGTAPDASASTVFGWTDGTGVVSSVGASIVDGACSGASWILRTTRTDQDWRWRLVDPDALYALPEVWSGIFSQDGGDVVSLYGRLVGIRGILDVRNSVKTVSDVCDSAICSPSSSTGGSCSDSRFHGYWIDPDGGYLAFPEDIAQNTTHCEIVSSSGSIHTAALGSSVFAIGRDNLGGSCMGGPLRTESITPILGNDSAFVEIPLV